MSNIVEHNQLILLKSTNSTCLVKSALNLHQQNDDDDILFLAHRETSFLKESFEILKNDMYDFDMLYPSVRCMFLKDSWSTLDGMYGKSFFINEIQKIMKVEKFSTLYFHRIDILFDESTHRDCERLITDIIESARYYHKKVIFSINNETKLGQILEAILFDIIDIEYVVDNTPAGGCHSSLRRSKSDPINIFLLSKSSEIVKFHQYIFKNDKYLRLQSAKKLNEKSYDFLENADVIIFNLRDTKLKNRLLTYIERQNLKIKFIFLSNDQNIRKRDMVKQKSRGIYRVFEKSFELSEYIHTLETLFRRKFYSIVQDSIESVEKKRYYTNSEHFKKSILNLLDYHIYHSVIVVIYKGNSLIKQPIIENCVRDQDIVYHDQSNTSLVFVLIDMLPSEALYLINRRLLNINIEIKSSNSLSIDQFGFYLGEKQKSLSKMD